MEFEFSQGFEPGGFRSVAGRVLIPALLFVAGDYPDKGVTITEAHLDEVITRFNAGPRVVPVKAEHFDSPLDPFGEVVALHRNGPNLFGMLAFSEGIAQHIAQRGAKNVSVAFHRESGEGGAVAFSLKECSLVFTPRVAGASLLSPEQIGQKMAAFRAAGKVTPAMEGPLSRLLASPPATVTFSDGTPGELDIAAEAEALVNALPVSAPRVSQIPPSFYPDALRASLGGGSHVVPAPAVSAPPAELANIAGKLGVPVEKVVAQFKAEGGRRS